MPDVPAAHTAYAAFVRPGDRLVITLQDNISDQEDAQQLADALGAALPGVQVLTVAGATGMVVYPREAVPVPETTPDGAPIPTRGEGSA